ncbi:MAG: hypothetical protein JW726_01700 [Anaerolineales bacterium]|nr:hypothetical protein [Anaerolineales bacterium]
MEGDSSDELKPVPSVLPRPCSVTLLALGVLTIAGWGLVRLVGSVRQWDFLSSLPGVSPFYVALSGLAWTIAGLPLFWGIWRGRAWAPRLAVAISLTYAIYYWLDVVFMMDQTGTEMLPGNWPFTVGLTAILLGYVAWVVRRPAFKAFFGDSDE